LGIPVEVLAGVGPLVVLELQPFDQDVDGVGEIVVNPVQDRTVGVGGGFGLGQRNLPMCGPSTGYGMWKGISSGGPANR